MVTVTEVLERPLPRVALERCASSAGQVWPELARSEQDAPARLAQFLNAAHEHPVGRQSSVDERQCHDPHAQPG